MLNDCYNVTQIIKLLTICIFHLQSNGLVKRGKGCFAINLTVPEIKVLILLSYFVVFGIVSLVNLTITLNEANPFIDDLFKYFACQLNGYDPKCEKFRRQLEKHLKPELNGSSFLLLGLITWVHILIATKAHDYKWLMQKMMSCYHSVVKVPLCEAGAVLSINKKPFGKASPDA